MLQSGSLEDGEGQTGGNFAAIAAAMSDIPYAAIADASYEELTQYVPDDVDLAEQVRPGVFRFEVPADTHMSFAVLSFGDDPVDVPFSSSIQGAVLQLASPTDVKVGGDAVESVMASALPYDLYQVHLDKGQQVRIHAGAPAGDMWVSVSGPGLEDTKDYDDSRTGLYGVDVDETFTAPAEGTYQLEVGSNDQTSVGYRLSLEDPTEEERHK
jgi:hypothetical protein